MKMKKYIALPLLGMLLLASCTIVNPFYSSSSQATSSSSKTGSGKQESGSSASAEQTLISSSSHTGGQASKPSSDYLEVGEEFHFYSINDFHGAIKEGGTTYYEGGLSKVFGKIHDLKNANPDNSFVFSTGDMWQGSLESNDNYGALINEAMNRDFDAMALGNHDFDYGQQYILTNQNNATFPFLAGNIYKWDGGITDKKWNTTSASTIIERGGLKLGVVGMIGGGQTTSITSQYVDDLYFDDPEEEAKNEALKLKSEGCNAVILLLHNSSSTLDYWSYDYGKNLKSYFDGVFCGHNHSNEKNMISGVPLLEAACNGEGISHFQLTYDGSSFSCGNYEIISASASWDEDEEMNSVINKYIGTSAFTSKANEKLFYSSSFLSKNDAIPNICCKAMFEVAYKDYPTICLAMDNSKRANISSGNVTYSDFYKAAPFMNNIVILHAKGKDIKSEAKYNYTYTKDVSAYDTLENNSYYDIAIIDYLSEHKNANKEYDYFSDRQTGSSYVLGSIAIYPIDCVAQYMKTLQGNVSSSDYTGTSNGYNLYK